MQQELKNVTIEEEYNTDMYSEDIDKHMLQILKEEVDNYKEAYKFSRLYRHD